MQIPSNLETESEWIATYIDDDPEGPIYPGWVPYTSMSTALAYLFTEEGFVIAADGRNTLISKKGREVDSNKAQKIFPIHSTDRQAALSFTGRTTLYDQADDHKVFDFPLEFNRAAREVQPEITKSAEEFLSRLCSLVQERLESAVQNIGIGILPSRRGRGDPSEHNIIAIHLDGYFVGRPARASANFYHIQQKLAWDMDFVQHTLRCPKRYWTRLLGSDKIVSLLFNTEDARLLRYRTEPCRRVAAIWRDSSLTITLQDAIEVGRNYIAACSDESLIEIDPENCQGIGGHIHIATITQQGGFAWVPGYEPAQH